MAATPTPGQTSTGQATLATVGDMPKHDVPTPTNPVYHTHKGYFNITTIKALLKNGLLHASHLGDDVLKQLGSAVGEAKFGGK